VSLQVSGLGKRFGDRVAVEGLTFSVAQGEVVGLLGPNGAGKTTTVRMLTGLLAPSEGEATVRGLSIRGDGEALRQTLGLLTEQPGLYERLSARDNLRFFARLHQLDVKAALARAEHYLRRFGLAGREEEPVGGFSKGMRQKLAIVRTLLHEPAVLFLDEPTSGLDPESARTVRDAIAELAEEGRTIVLCSHNLGEVERLCRRFAVIRGRLLGIETVAASATRNVLTLELEQEASPFAPSLEDGPFASGVRAFGRTLEVRLSEEDHAADVISLLVGAGARVREARRERPGLEERYLALMRGETP
jgi:ABC-2 type transport system ATP-binding protein